MANQIVVLGSCMIDFVSYSPRLPKRGETLKGTSFITNQGGKGANQCMSAAKLGGNVALIARVGDDHFGKEYLNILKSYSVDITHTRVTPNYSSGIAQIMVDESLGDNCIVIIPGANDALSLEDLSKAKNLLANTKVLVCQLETPIHITLKALKQFKGVSILNGAPAIENIDVELLKYATIFCVNETEATTVSGLKCDDLNDAKIVSNKLLEMGCNTVILTLGNKGAIIGRKDKSNISHILAEKVTAVDTTGAGDCFIGSLAFLIAKYPNFSLEQQVKIACQLASYSVQFPGTHKAFADANVLEKYLC